MRVLLSSTDASGAVRIEYNAGVFTIPLLETPDTLFFALVAIALVCADGQAGPLPCNRAVLHFLRSYNSDMRAPHVMLM